MFDFNEQFARNGADFTTDFFNLLAADGIKSNVIFSPFSIQTCVAMAFAGAQGETAQEIVNGLKFVSEMPTEVAETFQFVLEKYKNSNLLKIANKICVQEGKELKAAYKESLLENYHAEAENMDFSRNVEAAAAINQWVESKTAGKIQNLIPADCLNNLTRAVLLNAIYFKGDWASKFKANQTAEDDFWTSESTTVKIQYMHQKGKFNYGFFDDIGCTALEMPYKDSDLSMFVLLPQEREGLKTLATKLKTVNLVELANRMEHNTEVVVQFPKFKTEYSIELNDVLKKLGINKMFGDDADFSNMLESPEDITVSKVLHKAFIEVNEEGTEAAAATGMIMMTRMAMMPLQFIADRPFLYMIWNKKNILFAGALVTA